MVLAHSGNEGTQEREGESSLFDAVSVPLSQRNWRVMPHPLSPMRLFVCRERPPFPLWPRRPQKG